MSGAPSTSGPLPWTLWASAERGTVEGHPGALTDTLHYVPVVSWRRLERAHGEWDVIVEPAAILVSTPEGMRRENCDRGLPATDAAAWIAGASLDDRTRESLVAAAFGAPHATAAGFEIRLCRTTTARDDEPGKVTSVGRVILEHGDIRFVSEP